MDIPTVQGSPGSRLAGSTPPSVGESSAVAGAVDRPGPGAGLNVQDVALLLGASLVTHLNDAREAPTAYADERHVSACVFCDLLDRSGAVRVVGVA